MTLPLKTWWHELNTWEPDAALAFYGRTLGWQFEQAELPDGGGYWIARKDGRPVGGIFALTDPDYAGIPSHWMTYLAVSDISRAEHDAARAGGEVMRPSTHVPGVGMLSVVTDSAGALIGLFEPETGHSLARTH
ncbi:MAG: VOC family protein [Rhizobiales bacterium]|nr:VOC family protein [Hyphomicrobiales bacterium]